MPLDWQLPQSHAIAQRTSFVEFVPDAVPPLFATLALPIIARATAKMVAEVFGIRGNSGYFFKTINGYVYGFFDTRTIFEYLVKGTLGVSKIFRYGKTWRAEVLASSCAVANRWHLADLAALPAVAILAGVRALFGATADYFTIAQFGPISQSNLDETFFRRFYDMLVKRKSDPTAETFLLGLENVPLQAEQSLFDLAQWSQGQADLAEYLRETPPQAIWAALQADPIPAPLSGAFATSFAEHQVAFGHVTYDLDCSKPLPADDPVP